MRIARVIVDGSRTTYAIVENDHYRAIEGGIFGEQKITDEKIP